MTDGNSQPTSFDPERLRARLTMPQLVAVFVAGIGFSGMQTAIYTKINRVESLLTSSVTHDQWNRWESAFREENRSVGIKVPYMNRLIAPRDDGHGQAGY